MAKRRDALGTGVRASPRLYDFVDDNPLIGMFPVSYTNKPSVIAQNDNVVSINSAMQVDLMGQVVADTMGPGSTPASAVASTSSAVPRPAGVDGRSSLCRRPRRTVRSAGSSPR